MDRVTEHLPSSSTVYSLLNNVEGGDRIVIIDSNKDLPENWREQLNEMEGKVKLDEKWESFLDKREQDSKEDEDVNNVEDSEDNNIDGVNMLGIVTFGQRFKIINAGKLLPSGTANGTVVMNNEKDALMGSAAFSSDNVMEEDIMNIPTNSFESAENSEELSLTQILNVQLPYERTYYTKM